MKASNIHLIETLELPLSDPIWYPTAVKPGQSISIKAMVKYLNIGLASNRKAVLLIKLYDDVDEEVDVSFDNIFKSETFGAHFKYLVPTQGEIEELYTFVVPEGVTTIHFGFNRFLCSENEQVIVSDLTIYPEVIESPKRLEIPRNYYIEKLLLPLEDPIWYPTAVKPGQSISIKAMVKYLNIGLASNRKAVFLIKAYDDVNEEVDVSFENIFKSETFGAHFKYLVPTQGEIEELYTFVVPEGVTTIHFGFNRFLCSENEQVVISSFTVHAETETEVLRRFQKTSTQSKEEHLNLIFHKNISKTFSLERFVNGKYRFLITHQDSRVFSNRKTLMLFFGKLPEKVRKNKGLVVADINKQAFCYMGGGIQKGDTYYQDFYIEIDEVIKKSELFFYSTVEGFKIDSLLIENCALEKVEYNQPIKEATRGWSDINLNKINTDAIEFLLYADINANVVDGSSVWFSSMASILASKGKTAIIIKENLRHTQVVSNIENSHNVELITPEKLGFDGVFDIEKGVELLRKIDDISPNIRVVVVRGCEVAYRLSETRQFYNRLASYITDFYTVENNKLIMNEEKVEKLKLISLRSVYMLAQTRLIKNKITELTGNNPKYIDIPPPINDKFFEEESSAVNKLEKDNNFEIENSVLKIGYAGKITPGWGIFELFEFVEKLKNDGVDVELYMAANKISSSTNLKEFRQDIQNWFNKLDVKYYNNFNREQSLEMLSKMDFIWCFRPADFENATLELSTKLVESVAIGGKCLCYPSAINIGSLGEDYPFFIKDYDDFKSVLNKRDLQLDIKFSKKIWQNHSLKNISENFHSYFLSEPFSKRKILFASHDFKFIDAYISYLKSKQVPVKKEIWEWGGHKNERQLIESYKWADKIFCEWGLANAVWYSKNNQDNKPVYIRMHAQEIRERAQKFGRQIDTSSIEEIIFVSENIREQAINLFGYQKKQTKFIPNFVMDDEFYFSKRKKSNNSVVLGILGFVPQTKRLDRAVLLLDALRKSGIDAKLSVKGHRPEELEFMHAPSRIKELDYYYDTYKMIDNLELNNYVDFESWGANVRDWYEKVDVILSPSENESFHYAVADGVLSGCLPIVWNWKEAAVIYPKDWVVSNISEAQILVESYMKKSNIDNLNVDNRLYLIENFSFKMVRKKLNYLVF